MMELWKQTFHDSNRYIKLVFDTYFSPDNVFVRYEGEKLISALLGVPYRFSCNKENSKILSKGFYLCGLATHPQWREKGIMGQLMEEAENRADEMGYDMTFLIPADSHLREYYSKKGYRTASFRKRLVLDIPEIHAEDGKSKMYIYTIRDFLEKGKKSFVDDIAEWCNKIEMSNGYIPTIQHSKTDMMAVMAENENSIFLTECTFDPEYPILAKVMGVMFLEIPDDINKPLRIIGMYFKDKHCIFRESNIQNDNVHLPIIKDTISAIIRKYPDINKIEFLIPYVGESTCISGVEPYAMIKPIKNKGFFCKNENIKFNISLMLD